MNEGAFNIRGPGLIDGVQKGLEISCTIADQIRCFYIYWSLIKAYNNDCLLRLIAAIYRMAELQSYLQNIIVKFMLHVPLDSIIESVIAVGGVLLWVSSVCWDTQ